jgi:hypothetical protein
MNQVSNFMKMYNILHCLFIFVGLYVFYVGLEVVVNCYCVGMKLYLLGIFGVRWLIFWVRGRSLCWLVSLLGLDLGDTRLQYLLGY